MSLYAPVNVGYWCLGVVIVSWTMLQRAVFVGVVGVAAVTGAAPACSNPSYPANSSGWSEVTNIRHWECPENNGPGVSPDSTGDIRVSGTSRR